MGKNATPDTHQLCLGMTGFWGTPIANTFCHEADVLLAVGTRFAEADASSWDTRFTFQIPPTKLIHIDIDPMELGRNYPAALTATADSELALAAILGTARKLHAQPRTRSERGRFWGEQAKGISVEASQQASS